MKRPPSFALRLPRWHEWLIYAAAALLFATGIAWLMLDRFGKVDGEFGPEPSPALPWLLVVHGAAAYGFAIVAAMLIPVHMRLGWSAGRNRRSGLLLAGISLFLVLTGLALYYSTAEGVRSTASLTHWAVGLLVPALIILHLVRGKQSRPPRRD
jgi:thiosulfate reductase cytochrome b subunit